MATSLYVSWTTMARMSEREAWLEEDGNRSGREQD